jgi:hypothetical protein
MDSSMFLKNLAKQLKKSFKFIDENKEELKSIHNELGDKCKILWDKQLDAITFIASVADAKPIRDLVTATKDVYKVQEKIVTMIAVHMGSDDEDNDEDADC